MPIFKLGKTHIPHRKNTAKMAAVRMTPPTQVQISMAQHIGAPAVPVVKAGDKVFVGTLIGEASGYVSAPIHSSVSGTVKKIGEYLNSQGRKVQSVIIESDGEMSADPSIAPPVIRSFDDFSQAVRNSGLVGLGGAGFPTAVKLDAEKKGLLKKIVINGAECEPYITSDTRTMLDDTDYVKKGVELLLKYISAEEVVMGIEGNKPECIEVMTALFADNDRVRVEKLPKTYPQGAEKMLIYNTTGLIVPEGGLPSDVGCIVMNVTSVAFIAKYAETGMPLVEKCLTVDGSGIKNPMNVIAPIGASINDVVEFTGGFKDDVAKVLYGGPMMGIAVYSTDDPILKNNNAIVALSFKEVNHNASNPCIHCGRCVAACPMGLNPTAFAKALKVDDKEDRASRLEDAKINLCMECGCCSYVCPSRRPLVQNNRLAKADLREIRSAAKK
ncbi:MAG: electron transport complex subunit RsxC [Clostridia bacterium]|nr:electron transport complex subunit RsxC [Clostridia bacterium]